MKKRLLSILLTLTLVITLLPAGSAFAATSQPSDQELEELFEDMGFAGSLGGSGSTFSETEDVSPYCAFWFMSINGRLSPYYNNSTGCFELTFDEYITLMGNSFTNFNEDAVKEWLVKNDYYDAATDSISIYAGGMGDIWAWEPLNITKNGNTYKIDGLYLYGVEETGDVLDSDVEFYDWWMYTQTWTEDGVEQSATYKMGIEYGLTITAVYEDGNLKVSSYQKTPYYTYNGVTYCKDASNIYSADFDQAYTAKLAYGSIAYNGYARKPAVTITDKDGNTVNTYTVKYSNNVNPGKATAVISVDTGKWICEINKNYIIRLKAPVIKATTVAQSGKIKLTWGGVYKAGKYEIYRASAKNGTYKKVKTTTNKYWIDTTAVPEKTYWYKVKAINTANTSTNSYFSNKVSKVCDLAKPVITVKANAKGKPKVSWKKVPYADKYQVFRATSQDGKYTRIGTTTNLYFNNAKAVKGKTYYYKVKAISTKTTDANSAFSAVKKIKVKK